MTDVAVQAPGRERSALIWTALVVSTGALLVAGLDNLIVVPALPAIQHDFDATLQSLEWAVAAYALGFSLGLLGGASLGDRFGHRSLFVVGLTLFTAASAGCGLVKTVEVFDGVRAIQGLGAGLGAMVTLTIIGDAFRGERRSLVQGLWWGTVGLGVLLGPVVGGGIVSHADWRWIFWINVPIGIAAITLASVGLHPTSDRDARIDVVGLALAAAGLTGITWGLIRSGQVGWTSREVFPPLAAGALWLAAFVVWEFASPSAVIPYRALRQWRGAAVDGVSFLTSFSLFGSLFLLVQYVELVQGDSAQRTALTVAPAVGAAALLAPLAGALSARLGARPFVALGLLVQAAGLAWLAHVVAANVSHERLLPGFVAYGAGIGLFLPSAASLVFDSVRSEAEIAATGANNAIRAAGGGLGIAGLTAVLLGTGSYRSPETFTHGLTRALWVAAAVAAGGVVVSLLLPGRSCVREAVATVVDAPHAHELPAGDQVPPVAEAAQTAQELDRPAQEVEDPDRNGAVEAYQCPVCLGHGWFAFEPPTDPSTETCPRCYGHGHVLTGSRVPAHIARACPDCGGRGYVEARPTFEPARVRRVDQAPEPAEIETAPDPSVETEQPRPASSGWDELREKLRPSGSAWNDIARPQGPAA